MRLFSRALSVLISTAAMTVAALPAAAASYDFYCLTGNLAGDCAIGEAQLSVDVVDLGAGQVEFEFLNSGPADSSITDVYFDDGSLLGIASILNGSGVAFSQQATPANLPGGSNASPPFQTTAGFSADSDPPAQPSGVNPSEWVCIIFDLQLGRTYADVLTELANGTLRIGIHVQGFSSGGSESLINNVPEPGTALLLALGLGGLAAGRRRALCA